MNTKVLSGVWRLADPKVTMASMSSIFLAACAAAAEGPLAWGWLAWVVAGIFFLEVAKNASGEIFDFDSGADQGVARKDRSPFSGGKRVLVDGLLSREQTAAVASLGYALGIAVGLWIVIAREPWALVFGLAGVALAYFYHAPPVSLSYRGLGETAVGLAYGPLIGLGAYVVLSGEPFSPLLPLFVPLGLLITAFLWINEFPDHDADRAAGKRTLVVRLGRPLAAKVFVVLIAAAGLWLWALPSLGWPSEVRVGLIGIACGAEAARRLLRYPNETARIIPAQALTLASFILAALGSGAGLLLS